MIFVFHTAASGRCLKKNRRKIKTAPSLGLGLILIHRWWPANHLILLEEVLVCDSAMRVNNRCKKAGCLGLCTATAVCVCAHGCMCVCACVCECSCVSLLVGCFFPIKAICPMLRLGNEQMLPL